MTFAHGKAREFERKGNPSTEYLIFTTNGESKSFCCMCSGEKNGGYYLKK